VALAIMWVCRMEMILATRGPSEFYSIWKGLKLLLTIAFLHSAAHPHIFLIFLLIA
jgi:hypothetical protein